jgi:hypothetical protein
MGGRARAGGRIAAASPAPRAGPAQTVPARFISFACGGRRGETGRRAAGGAGGGRGGPTGGSRGLAQHRRPGRGRREHGRCGLRASSARALREPADGQAGRAGRRGDARGRACLRPAERLLAIIPPARARARSRTVGCVARFRSADQRARADERGAGRGARRGLPWNSPKPVPPPAGVRAS